MNKDLPEHNGFTSDFCILNCEDGKRHIGYYHSNEHWYEISPAYNGSTLLKLKVLSWEYLNPKND